MKWLLWVGAALALGVGIALIAARDPGYLLLYWNGWQIEIRSLVIAVALLLVLFFLLHWLLNLGGDLRRGGERLRYLGSVRRRTRARRDLVKGLLELAEGHWQSAERRLVHRAADSDTPLLNYLAAARAAGELGVLERRDRYLAKAHESSPGADVAIGLSQAEEQMRSGQYEQCLATLHHLRGIDPNHPHVLKMLLRAYQALNDHSAQLDLLPRLRRAKLLGDEELDALERTGYREKLSAAEDPMVVWTQLPRALQRDPQMVDHYAKLLQARGDEQAALSLLQNHLRKRWHSGLATLYGRLASCDLDTHLAIAGRWESRHGEDPGLLLTLARLHRLNGDRQQSMTYFERAIELNPTAEARRELGSLLDTAGDTTAALSQFRAALEQVAPTGRDLPVLTVAGPAAEHRV